MKYRIESLKEIEKDKLKRQFSTVSSKRIIENSTCSQRALANYGNNDNRLGNVSTETAYRAKTPGNGGNTSRLGSNMRNTSTDNFNRAKTPSPNVSSQKLYTTESILKSHRTSLAGLSSSKSRSTKDNPSPQPIGQSNSSSRASKINLSSQTSGRILKASIIRPSRVIRKVQL